MRIFFGIPIKGELLETSEHLKQKYESNYDMKKAHWTPTENLHMTLRFIGEASDEQVSQLTELASDISFQNFNLTTNGILLLPHKKPRIFALSIRLNDGLAELIKQINRISNACGFKQEARPFLPHITLCRWKIPLHNPPNINFHQSVHQSVDEVHLYKSESGESGSIYTPISSLSAD